MDRINSFLMVAMTIGGAQAAVLVALGLAGLSVFWVVAAAIALASASMVALMTIWSRDIATLNAAIGRIGASDAPPILPEPIDLVTMEPLGVAVARLSRRLAQRAETMERDRLADSLILERLPDPLVVLAEDRSIRRMNAAARTAYGDDLPAVLRNPELRTAIDRALSANAVQGAELSLPVPVPREVRAVVVPMDPPLADGGRTVVIFSDRSRERAVEQMRADFVANVSHELRSPLAALIGFTETLRGPAASDPPAQQRFLAIMAEQAARMNRLIDDLLYLSQVELTEHQAPSDPVDLIRQMTQVAATFAPKLAASGMGVTVDAEPDIPSVQGDGDQIVQLLHNLVDNAVKYGRGGRDIRLSVNQPARDDPRWPPRRGVLMTVADKGGGIPKEHLSRLTERFYRVDKGRSRDAGGTGLGLAIVKHIVNRHRGRLVFESDTGQGTTVRVWLPVTQGSANPAQPQA